MINEQIETVRQVLKILLDERQTEKTESKRLMIKQPVLNLTVLPLLVRLCNCQSHYVNISP